ncbi:MAG: YggT family protein [Tissierellia bacterium]|nr:YggT family protein [Tissierellia bacterium]MDD4725784.1 YggT family protein [Tissierellia bacterium]
MTNILKTLELFFKLLEILIIIRVFLNIFRISRDNVIVGIIYEMTEPVLIPARTILDKLNLNRGMIDFSPWIAIILLNLIYSLILRILF